MNQLLREVRPVMKPLAAPRPMGSPTGSLSAVARRRAGREGPDGDEDDDSPARMGFRATSKRISGRGDMVQCAWHLMLGTACYFK